MHEYPGLKSINESMGILGRSQKVAVPILIITLMIPFPCSAYLCSHSHGHPIPMGFLFPCTSLVVTRESERLKKSNSVWLNSGNALIQRVKMQFSCFPFSDSAETQVIWGCVVKRVLIAYFIGNISVKKYQNPFTCLKVSKPKVGRFVETRCRVSAEVELNGCRFRLWFFAVCCLFVTSYASVPGTAIDQVCESDSECLENNFWTKWPLSYIFDAVALWLTLIMSISCSEVKVIQGAFKKFVDWHS